MSMVRKVVGLLVLLALSALALLVWSGVGGLWWAGQARATVIDANNRQPIEGAIVLANWPLKGLEGWPMEQVALTEVTTDATGIFTLPGWGPQLRMRGGTIRPDEPTVRILRGGYLPLIIRNKPIKGADRLLAALGRRSFIARDIIELQPLRGSPARYAAEFRTFQLSIDFLYASGNCEWQRAPWTVTAVSALDARMKAEGHDAGLVGLDEIAPSPQCGDAKEVLREYMK